MNILKFDQSYTKQKVVFKAIKRADSRLNHFLDIILEAEPLVHGIKRRCPESANTVRICIRSGTIHHTPISVCYTCTFIVYARNRPGTYSTT